AKEDILATENNITLQVTQAYLQILQAKEEVTYFNSLVETATAQTQQAELKFKAGRMARADVAQLQAQLANDQYNFVSATNAHEQSTFNLKCLLQLAPTTDFQVATPDTLHLIEDSTPFTIIGAEAIMQRPEVKSSELTKQAASFQLLKARAGRKPVLTLNTNIASDYSNNLPKGYSQQIDKNIYERVGLTLSLPILNNRTVKTNIAKSEIAIEQADVNLLNTQTVLRQEVEQADINRANSKSQLQAAEKQLAANEESYRLSQEQLNLGAITATDFLVQKNLYVQAMQTYLQAKYNALIAVQVYRFYKGDSIEL
ncbi:MAG TPA: TolC family protein, partial [Niastella sp.]|nr:TolC family protein [Niastella sp.]